MLPKSTVKLVAVSLPEVRFTIRECRARGRGTACRPSTPNSKRDTLQKRHTRAQARGVINDDMITTHPWLPQTKEIQHESGLTTTFHDLLLVVDSIISPRHEFFSQHVPYTLWLKRAFGLASLVNTTRKCAWKGHGPHATAQHMLPCYISRTQPLAAMHVSPTAAASQ